MTEERFRLHDAWVKWLTLVLGVAGFVIALYTYQSQQVAARQQNAEMEKNRVTRADSDAKAREEEYKRRFWERQIDLYAQAARAASTIATAPDIKRADYTTARGRFDQLYFGELCIVESKEVAQQMVTFRTAILEYEKTSSAQNREALQAISLDLAHACRKSTEEVWNIPLGKLPKPSTTVRDDGPGEPKAK